MMHALAELWPKIIPVTVVGAFLIFLLKELVEYFKRRKGDQRKLKSIRAMLARECELNNWTIKRLHEAVGIVEDEHEFAAFSVLTTETGQIKFRSDRGKASRREFPLPIVYRSIAEKYVLDVAMLDSQLSKLLDRALDQIAALEHIRTSLIDFIAAVDEDDRWPLKSFPTYAKSVLDEVLRSINALYQNCTGKELETYRLR